MNDYLAAQLHEHCVMVQRGKPMSILMYQERYHEEVTNVVKDAGLLYRATLKDNKWGEIIIFKNQALRYIIDSLPDEPKTPTDHYLLGCLFGYSHEAICEFILKNL